MAMSTSEHERAGTWVFGAHLRTDIFVVGLVVVLVYRTMSVFEGLGTSIYGCPQIPDVVGCMEVCMNLGCGIPRLLFVCCYLNVFLEIPIIGECRSVLRLAYSLTLRHLSKIRIASS